MRRYLPLIPLFLVAAACSGEAAESDSEAVTSSATAEPEAFLVEGVVDVPVNLERLTQDHENPAIGTPCVADNAYADISEAGQVTVRDAEGTTVALGELSRGSIILGEESDLVFHSDCRFRFRVEDVPEGSDFYEVSVPGFGPQSYSREDLVSLAEFAAD